jgi:hypothetical protein
MVTACFRVGEVEVVAKRVEQCCPKREHLGIGFIRPALNCSFHIRISCNCKNESFVFERLEFQYRVDHVAGVDACVEKGWGVAMYYRTLTCD